MSLYNIGNSAIRANQIALQTIANNIANADTEGYHRQRVSLAESVPYQYGSLLMGTGVTVQGISRVVDSATEQAIALTLSSSGKAQVQLETLQTLEGFLTPGNSSLQSAVTDYFNKVELLASTPNNSTRQQEVLTAAQNVANQLNSLQSQMDQLQSQLTGKITESVSKVNSLVEQIGTIEKQIQTAKASGRSAPTLEDQRDILVQELGKLVDLSPASLSHPDSQILAAGGWIIVGQDSPKLSVQQTADGKVQVVYGASKTPIQPVSGELAGLLDSQHQIVPEVRAELEEWTRAFIAGVNKLQATGMGAAGPQTLVSSTIGNVDPDAPLAQANTLFPINNGLLAVSITNQSTGEHETFTIPVNPSTDTLRSVTDQLDAFPHLRATLTTAGQLTISSDSGYSFDFAGRPSSTTNTALLTGTTIPTVSGVYTGVQNTQFVVTAQSSGQIGVTSPLHLSITDATTGQVVRQIDIGSGYPAGQPIEIAEGLSLRFSTGTMNAGDTFTIDAITDSDSSGFLTGMGIGGVFQTTDFRNIKVNPDLIANSKQLSLGRTGNPADVGQLNRLIAFRETRVLNHQAETVEGRLASLTANIGVSVNLQQSVTDQLDSQYQQLRNRQDSVSGVDPNEELLSMLQFQRAFQANARYLSSVNSALDDLLGLLR
ncbi:flagellar hook-associated protein FlgK [Planctomicrobium sp. SH527]|uniref:flagellar hook-associated protein FlgK n=1 Tax=Planctomicrobium sp. SH527 TaxID=3448123 RepID=UPI003F5BEF8C